jgi:hypothetical protein
MSREIAAKPQLCASYPDLLSIPQKQHGGPATSLVTPMVSHEKQELEEDGKLPSKQDEGPATLLVMPAVSKEEREDHGGRLSTRFKPYFLAKSDERNRIHLEGLHPVEKLDGDEIRSIVEKMSETDASDLRDEIVYLFRGFRAASQRSGSARAESQAHEFTDDIRTQGSTDTGSENPAAICLSISTNDGEVVLQPYIKPADVRLKGSKIPAHMDIFDFDPSRPFEFEESVRTAYDFASKGSIPESAYSAIASKLWTLLDVVSKLSSV